MRKGSRPDDRIGNCRVQKVAATQHTAGDAYHRRMPRRWPTTSAECLRAWLVRQGTPCLYDHVGRGQGAVPPPGIRPEDVHPIKDSDLTKRESTAMNKKVLGYVEYGFDAVVKFGGSLLIDEALTASAINALE